MVFSCAPDRRPHRCRVSALLWPPQPQRTSAGVDAFYVGWRVDFPDDATMLQAWTCRGQANFTGFCDWTYDGLLARAARTIRASHREKLYAHLEGMLVGRRGAFPFIPVR